MNAFALQVTVIFGSVSALIYTVAYPTLVYVWNKHRFWDAQQLHFKHFQMWTYFGNPEEWSFMQKEKTDDDAASVEV
eukprot:CAMPEP_0197708312 /NCGR_PEP_ID=MMETSP1338-20131121/127893_1 /TAXON_ID=43686 ORGANISM="Pelagodinium beii, Strain RCC1491" /NCGR_SAMPLE_ID=MMETSP1338 /ASSEMBLY_ACC=CAM_ASM_000754 /LENGTH=76 /DNA_ID=CAMNT_0043292243 /DNA_START=403 /DNA_END=633 /DNA_ORIENTATION=-